MARTATPKEEPTAIQTPEKENTADVHHLVMTLAATNSPDQLPGGAVTGDMADERIRTWLEMGYRLAFVETIAAGDVNGIFTLQMLYIMVKD